MPPTKKARTEAELVLDPDVVARAAELVGIRRHIHQSPELSFEETATSAFILDRCVDTTANCTIEFLPTVTRRGTRHADPFTPTRTARGSERPHAASRNAERMAVPPISFVFGRPAATVVLEVDARYIVRYPLHLGQPPSRLAMPCPVGDVCYGAQAEGDRRGRADHHWARPSPGGIQGRHPLNVR